MIRFLILGVLCSLWASGVERYALFIGANNGGAKKERLLYAQSDAEAVENVLIEMGGLEKERTSFLREPNLKEIKSAISNLASKMKNSEQGLRREFVFYYSGHADDKGIFTGSQQIDYAFLKNEIDALDAEVKIAIVDACASGAMTRLKGGVRRQPFLAGDHTELKGYAILTSSSENEVSQESDRIGGSFFTHYLVSGMRGAADASGDGRVTLSEAYQYAFQETTAKTSRTKGGVQHPNYDMKLSGVGEVVITDTRKIDAGVSIPQNSEGRFFFKNSAGMLVAELSKVKGQMFRIGLPIGSYEIIHLKNGKLFHTKLTLGQGENKAIDENDFLAFVPESTVSRGGEDVDRYVLETQADQVEDQEEVDAEEWEFLVNQNHQPTKGLQMSLFGNFAHRRHRGLQLGIFVNYAKEDVNSQISAGVNIALGNVNGVQLASVANLAGGRWSWNTEEKLIQVNGLQASSTFNYAESILGVQASGAYNGALDVEGAQFASAFNSARNLLGFQGAGAMNLAGNVKGAQVAGAVNWVQTIQGAQVGVFNYADTVRGAQIGIFNIANQNEGVAIGLFNYANNGLTHMRTGVDETGMGYMSLVTGMPMLYNEYIAGGTESENPQKFFIGVGLGSRLWNSTYFDFHLGAQYLWAFEESSRDEPDWEKAQHSVVIKNQVSYKPFEKYFAIIGGMRYTMSYHFAGEKPLLESEMGGAFGTKRFKHWPGLYMGIALGQI